MSATHIRELSPKERANWMTWISRIVRWQMYLSKLVDIENDLYIRESLDEANQIWMRQFILEKHDQFIQMRSMVTGLQSSMAAIVCAYIRN